MLQAVHRQTPIPAGAVRSLLRSATADDHAVVDSRFAGLIGEGANGYRDFLRLSAAAVTPLEAVLRAAKVERILPDWEDRSRAATLRADLADLGVPLPRSSLPPPPAGGEAHQFGILYVLEGSRLGAKVLVRRLLESPDFATPFALRYLRHGEGRPLWRTFLERLESSEAVRRSPADTVAGAHAAFTWFGANANLVAAPTVT